MTSERLPIWAANLLFFLLLFCMVLFFFFYQLKAAKNAFFKDVKAHGRLVAEMVSLNAKGAVLAGGVVEEVFGRFLSNNAKFIDHLNRVQPFNSEELTAFARESGLAGIQIVSPNGLKVEGPAEWTRDLNVSCGSGPSLSYLPDRHLTVLTVSGAHADCIALAVDTQQIDDVLAEIGLKNTLSNLYRMEGIRYVRIEGALLDELFRGSLEQVQEMSRDLEHVVEERVPLETGGFVVVGIDATLFHEMTSRLTRDFIGFGLMLLVVGSLLSWWLYVVQKRHVQAVQDYEQSLSLQREEASLGKATAAIAHEIRNPLNAIAMAMQRLVMEVEGLSHEHRRLLEVSLGAVARANKIIIALLNYARPMQLELTTVRLKTFIEDSLTPYYGPLERLGIALQLYIEDDLAIELDSHLFGQVMDNVIKNAIDAQPNGGFLRITTRVLREDIVRISIQNAGCLLSEQEMQRVFEPYYTTKAQGTGLGLAIVRRIVQVHRGKIYAFAQNGVFELVMEIPRHVHRDT